MYVVSGLSTLLSLVYTYFMGMFGATATVNLTIDLATLVFSLKFADSWYRRVCCTCIFFEKIYLGDEYKEALQMLKQRKKLTKKLCPPYNININLF